MSEVKRYGSISELVNASEKLLEIYPAMTVYVKGSDYDTLREELTESHRREALLQDMVNDKRQLEIANDLLHQASIKLAKWLTVKDSPRAEIIAFLEKAKS